MNISGFLSVFLCGVFGGFLGELLKWYNFRTVKKLPRYLKSPFYWFITILIILSGGLLAILYGYDDINAILAVNIGLSCPLIVRTLAYNGAAVSDNSTRSFDMKSIKSLKLDTKQFKLDDELINIDINSNKINKLIEFLAGK